MVLAHHLSVTWLVTAVYKEFSKPSNKKANNPIKNEQKIWIDTSHMHTQIPLAVSTWKTSATSSATNKMQIKTVKRYHYT